MVKHYQVQLPSYKRGFHLITNEILNEVKDLPKDGMLHIFIQHTSAGICVNENADPNVLYDFETSFDRLVPETNSLYTHTLEGSDDMPAHIKSVLSGVSVSIPIVDYRLALGTWQGIYLCEFRNNGGRRKLIISIIS